MADFMNDEGTLDNAGFDQTPPRSSRTGTPVEDIEPTLEDDDDLPVVELHVPPEEDPLMKHDR